MYTVNYFYVCLPVNNVAVHGIDDVHCSIEQALALRNDLC